MLCYYDKNKAGQDKKTSDFILSNGEKHTKHTEEKNTRKAELYEVTRLCY